MNKDLRKSIDTPTVGPMNPIHLASSTPTLALCLRKRGEVSADANRVTCEHCLTAAEVGRRAIASQASRNAYLSPVRHLG